MTTPLNMLISIIVPTRARLEKLKRFFDSLAATTANPGSVEIILVVDQDDTQTLIFQHSGMLFKLVVVPPGLTMGELNRAGYAASQGNFVMLLNDDVVARTNRWDEKILEVFQTFPDEVVLVHVNDMIFQEKLCTFPFVTRAYCEIAGSICPDDYDRYRIDDHIYNVFNLLAVLGKKRIIYLPQVIFEHTNTGDGSGTNRYVPIPEIHASDTQHFDRLLANRKDLAVKLAEKIDRHLSSRVADTRQKVLAPIHDSVALRKPEFVLTRQENCLFSSQNTRVTIGVVSANIKGSLAKTCIDAIKKYTANYDLIILDNNFGPNFNHSREMNRILSICRTDFLVLMDDDVFVHAGWLDNMLRCVTHRVGVVTPMHMDACQTLFYAGVAMRPDYSGNHSHFLQLPHEPTRIQTLCSAIMLIDVAKCGHVRVDESYSKYFLDLDYGLQIWEAGYEVVLSPYAIITHIGGGTMQQGSAISDSLYKVQRAHFVREWMDSRRYHALEENVWATIPEINKWLSLPARLEQALRTCFDELNPIGFRQVVGQTLQEIEEAPALKLWVSEYFWDFIQRRQDAVNPTVHSEFSWLSGYIGHASILANDFIGFRIVSWFGRYYAVPAEGAPFNPEWFFSYKYPRQFAADSMDILKARIYHDLHEETSDYPAKEPKRKFAAFGLIKEFVRVLLREKANRGAWGPAVVIVSKKTIRWVITRLFGYGTFLTLKNNWRMLTGRSDMQPAFAADGSASVGFSKADGADSRRWAESSPQADLAQTYRGYKCYRYEFKYFGVPEKHSGFSYADFLVGQYGDDVVIAHSMTELKASIDRLLQSDKGQSILIASFSNPLPSLAEKCACALVASNFKGELGTARVIKVKANNLFDWARGINEEELAQLKAELLGFGINRATIPWRYPDSWQDNTLEVLASKLVDVVDVIQPNGSTHTYEGENLHRLLYNKAYLCSMFSVVPQPTNMKVLEVGCSDGLVCDIFAQLGSGHITGIDVMDTVGCGFRNPAITYRAMDATKMEFPDQSFDITYSIATFEHVPDPYAVLSEMLRVTKIGGYCYVQAAPLYHSPFGHHMFAYFQDYPWIHMRKTPAQILDYMKQHGIDKKIEQDFAISCESYLSEMLTHDHINGLFLQDYGLNMFAARPDIQILMMNTSYEGRERLTDEMISKIQGIHPDRLVEHGFEIAFKRIS